jgi:prepilin-type N-terminal cleavage/methylation domain-containing protein
MTCADSRQSSGFTLVEMMLVSILIGVLAAVASSAWSDSGDYRLNLIQTEVTDAVDYAKALARSSREAHGVVFDPSTERLAVVDGSGTLVVDTLTKGDYVLDFTGTQYPRGIDILSADFGDTGMALVVDPKGSVLRTGTVVISYAGVSRTLTVEAATTTVSGS